MQTWLDVYQLFNQILEEVDNSGKYQSGTFQWKWEIDRRVKLLVSAFPENEQVQLAYEKWNEGAEDYEDYEF